MQELRTQIDIAATPERVWAVLSDFNAYNQWNPLLKRAKGVAAVGERVPMLIAMPFGPAMPMRMHMQTVTPNRELMWVGTAPLLLRGEHWFKIEPLGSGVRLLHGERFSGLVPGMLGQRLIAMLQPSYEALNVALKARVERG